MASLLELEETLSMLRNFNRDLKEEIERLEDTKNPETRSRLIKKIQNDIFQIALKMPFDIKVN